MILFITLILEILLMSAFCHGIYILFWDGMILGKAGKWYTRKYDLIDGYLNHIDNLRAAGFNAGLHKPITPAWTDWVIYYAFKPIIGCVICYASFWGSIAFLGLKIASNANFSAMTVIEWLIAITCTAFVNYKFKGQ